MRTMLYLMKYNIVYTVQEVQDTWPREHVHIFLPLRTSRLHHIKGGGKCTPTKNLNHAMLVKKTSKNKKVLALTWIVKRIATIIIAYPALYDENSWRRCLATKTQNTATGPIINNKVTSNDLASGPNINLPPRKKICKRWKIKMLFNYKIQTEYLWELWHF